MLTCYSRYHRFTINSVLTKPMDPAREMRRGGHPISTARCLLRLG